MGTPFTEDGEGDVVLIEGEDGFAALVDDEAGAMPVMVMSTRLGVGTAKSSSPPTRPRRQRPRRPRPASWLLSTARSTNASAKRRVSLASPTSRSTLAAWISTTLVRAP